MPSRIEREIEEILTRMDGFVPREPRRRRWSRRLTALARRIRGRLRAATAGLTGGHAVLAAALVLVLATFVIRPFAPLLARWLTYGSLLVIFGAIFFSIRPMRRGYPSTRYWRGQPVDLRGPGPLLRLRMWWRRRNRRW
jgi:hypothetical protein